MPKLIRRITVDLHFNILYTKTYKWMEKKQNGIQTEKEKKEAKLYFKGIARLH